jgi:hypothetical protein
MEVPMNARPTIALTVLLAVGLSPALAQDRADDPEAQEETKAEKPKKKLICRTEKVTGSLTRVKRICGTEEEWDEMTTDTQQAHSNEVRKASGTRCWGANC